MEFRSVGHFQYMAPRIAISVKRRITGSSFIFFRARRAPILGSTTDRLTTIDVFHRFPRVNRSVVLPSASYALHPVHSFAYSHTRQLNCIREGGLRMYFEEVGKSLVERGWVYCKKNDLYALEPNQPIGRQVVRGVAVQLDPCGATLHILTALGEPPDAINPNLGLFFDELWNRLPEIRGEHLDGQLIMVLESVFEGEESSEKRAEGIVRMASSALATADWVCSIILEVGRTITPEAALARVQVEQPYHGHA